MCTQEIGSLPCAAHAAAVPCRSLSTTITDRPSSARVQARLTAIVLLPVPPLRLPRARRWCRSVAAFAERELLFNPTIRQSPAGYPDLLPRLPRGTTIRKE